MHFASIWNHFIKHSISVEFLLVKGYLPGALRQTIRITPLVERFKIATLGSLADKFCQYLEQFT